MPELLAGGGEIDRGMNGGHAESAFSVGADI